MDKWFYQHLRNSKKKILQTYTIRFLKIQQFPHHPLPFTSVLLVSAAHSGRFLVYKNGKVYEEVVGQKQTDLLTGRSTLVDNTCDVEALFTFYLDRVFHSSPPLNIQKYRDKQ